MRMNALISNVGARVHVKLKKIMAAIEHFHYTLWERIILKSYNQNKKEFSVFHSLPFSQEWRWLLRSGWFYYYYVAV